MGVSDSSTLNSGHNGSLKAWNNLTKRMGFGSTDYHRSATQPTNEAINPPPIPVVKDALFWIWTATIWTKIMVLLLVFLSISQNKYIYFCHLKFHLSSQTSISIYFNASPNGFIHCVKVWGGRTSAAGPSRRSPERSFHTPSSLSGLRVQNVRIMLYGLLRNHSPAQVTQCSAIHE